MESSLQNKNIRSIHINTYPYGNFEAADKMLLRNGYILREKLYNKIII
jgi:hypothetical protein